MELDGLPIDKVCRTCLRTSNESLDTLYSQDESDSLNLLQMFCLTFGTQIVNRKEDFRYWLDNEQSLILASPCA